MVPGEPQEEEVTREMQGGVTSARSVKILAALVWCIGGGVLLWKGSSLLTEADALNPQFIWSWAAGAIGLAIGGVKARYLFSKACRKNLRRIDALERPRFWQCFRPRFVLFLAAMIAAGATLSRLAHGSYGFLIGVAILDLSIGTALLGSSFVCRQKKTGDER